MVGAVVLAVGVSVAPERDPNGTLSQAEIERMDAAASAAAASEAAEEAATLRVAVLGDSYTLGANADPGQGFVDLLGRQNPHWTYEVFGQGGTGYINPGTGTESAYLERVPDVVTYAPELVIVEGGINDAADPKEQQAATAVFEALKQGLPDSRVVVLGPIDTPVAAREDVARDAIQAAAEAADLTFLDAFTWVDVGDPSLWDDIHPTTAGHAVLAQQLQSALVANQVIPAA